MSMSVCSNCGARCGEDTRGGSMDHYLTCECGSAKNSYWYDDGRGGYTVYLNDAHPVEASEYGRKQSQEVSREKPQVRDWSRDDD